MKKWTSKVFIGGVLLFLYLPILVLVVFSFNDTKLNILFEGFTLEWYSVLLDNRTLLESLKNTLIVAGLSTLISTIIGTISAYGLSRYNFRGKSLINSLLYIPIVMPDIVIGISLLAIYTLMRFRLGMFTLILSHITFSIPYVLVSVRSALEGMNPYLEEASSDLGANSIETFFRITLPSIMPGILSGALLVFTLSMDDVVISYFTTGPDAVTLPQYIYSMIKSGITPDVNALFSIMLLVTLIGVTIYSYILFKKRVRGRSKYCLIILLLFLTGCNKEEKEVINVLNWSSYIPDSVIRDFEREYNIEVNYSTYSSNEELLAKVSSVGEGTYDLVFPSDYMIEIMRSKDLIQKIDKSKLNNYGFIDYKYLGLDYDVNNEYSIPFLSAGIVLAVNRDYVRDNINGYNDLVNSKYKNSIVLVDDTRIVIGSALMALGYDMNSVDKEKLEEAKEWLLRLKPNIKAFDSDSPKSFLISRESSIGLMWSAEAIMAKEYNPNIEIIIPKEGYTISVDNFAIMKGSRNIDNVYLFIDYILDSDVMEKIVNYYPYSSVNVETNRRISMNKEIGYDYSRMLNMVSRGKRVRNIGQSISIYDKIWASIK